MLISKVSKPLGRRPISQEVRDLISQMVTDNPSWGTPCINGELLMLGFDLSERPISRWMKRTQTTPDPAKHWITFLRNHNEAIAAMDFFRNRRLLRLLLLLPMNLEKSLKV